MPPSLRETLDQEHPLYSANKERWLRYEAFSQPLDTLEGKKAWLPQGAQESDIDYRTRVKLTHCLGQSRAAIRRIVGALTKTPTPRNYGESGTDSATKVGMPTEVRNRLAEFDLNVDRKGTSIDAYVKRILPCGLALGQVGVLVDRIRVAEPMPNAEEESRVGALLPFLEPWTRAELINWDEDEHSRLKWVVLHRVVTVQASALESRQRWRVWKVIDRMTGTEYRQRVSTDSAAEENTEVLRIPPWTHGLGIVPFARLCPLDGQSYIDELSLADLRKLQLDSDQGHASYLHGSPQLVLKTARDLKEVGIGVSNILKLNPDEKEDAAYLTVDTGGMETRERIIESTLRQGMNLAGIDPQSQTTERPANQRSGVSIALGFSTSEEPTLVTITDEMDDCDREIHEIVARYVSNPREFAPDERVFGGEIARVKTWDLMAADRVVDLAGSAAHLVKSETWKRFTAKYIARQVPGNMPEDTATKVDKELDSADYSTPEPADIPGIDGQRRLDGVPMETVQ